MKDIIARLAGANLKNDLEAQAILQELREHADFPKLVNYCRIVRQFEIPAPGEETFWSIFELIGLAKDADESHIGWANA